MEMLTAMRKSACPSACIFFNWAQAALLGQRDELVGRYEAAVVRAPAQQRLGTDDAAAVEVDLGLVDDEEMVLLEAGAQALEQLEALARVAAHGGREVLR
jgi:hypothetical protein